MKRKEEELDSEYKNITIRFDIDELELIESFNVSGTKLASFMRMCIMKHINELAGIKNKKDREDVLNEIRKKRLEALEKQGLSLVE